MLERTLIELADENLAESHREFSRWHDRCVIVEEGGLLLTLGADRFPGVNFSMRAGPQRTSPMELMERSQAFFRESADGFAIRTRMHCDDDLITYCQQRELACVGDSPGLVIEQPLPDESLPKGVSLSRVDDLAGAGELASVSVRAYHTIGLPVATGEKMFERVERLLSPHLHGVVAHVEGKPAAAAMVLLSHGIAGIYWVGTTPEARGHGLASHVTRAVGNWAFDHGAGAVVLQASKQGDPIYRAMGYREFTRYPWFLSRTEQPS